MPKTPEEIAADDGAAEEAAASAAADAGVTEDATATIADLRKKLDEETAARQSAERRANAATGAAATAAVEVQDANMHLVVTAIDTVNATQAALKARLRDAMAGSDFETAADIQVEISTNAAKLVQLENGKQAMEEEAKNPTRMRREEIPMGDPVEELARTLTPKSADWVRKHPQYVTDARLNRKMIRAHQDAIDDGCAPDSREYFDYVEERLLKTAAPTGDAAVDAAALSAAAEAQKRRDAATPPPAIPPARGGTPKNGRNLTPEEKEIAASNGMTEEEYAKNKEALKAEGRLH